VKRRVLAKIGGSVTFRRRADVAALCVHQHDQTGLFCGASNGLQRFHAFRAVTFEQGNLRLDTGDPAFTGVDHGKAPGCQPFSCIPAEQCRDPAGMRVDADAKRPMPAGGIDQAVGKAGHGFTLQATLTTCNRRRALSDRGP
jgi:hypothetical protein